MRWLKRLAPRLLAFNLLLVFLPVAGLMAFGTHERQLLEAQERSMVQQGRLVAAALAGSTALDPAAAVGLVARLGGQIESRLRVVARDGTVLADSATAGPRRASGESGVKAAVAATSPPAPTPQASARQQLTYRIGAWLYRLPGVLFARVPPPRDASPVSSRRLRGTEIDAALAGRYGAATRRSPGQRSLTLYSALPVRAAGGKVVGAVLVSQSTSRSLASLWALRLGMFRIVLGSLAVAALLSLVVAGTISRPLARLRNEAEAPRDGRGRPLRSFSGSGRGDEIGDLARALERLTARLEAQLDASESFAADVAHEFKNPLTAIANAAEMLAVAEHPEDRARFASLVEREVSRLERLLSGVQEITHLAAAAEEDPPEVDLVRLLGDLSTGFGQQRGGPEVLFRTSLDSAPINMPAERAHQVFENLLANAVSFSPPGGRVEVEVGSEKGGLTIAVRDEGPGIPPDHLSRIFERFFTWRPDAGGERRHEGLGLAIVRSLVERYGGSVRASNRPVRGAELEVRLPLASHAWSHSLERSRRGERQQDGAGSGGRSPSSAR